MLVLTRRLSEGIRIGADVRIVVLAVNGDQVRVGIEAPRGKTILRDEVFERLVADNLEAASHAVVSAPALSAPETAPLRIQEGTTRE
jgi:carbon storage regulator